MFICLLKGGVNEVSLRHLYHPTTLALAALETVCSSCPSVTAAAAAAAGERLMQETDDSGRQV